MPGCSVKLCRNNYKNNPNVSYFRFPSDGTELIWKGNGQIEEFTPESRICSEHFSDEEFVEPLSQKTLVHGAIPSINLPAPVTHRVDIYKSMYKKSEEYHANILGANIEIVVHITKGKIDNPITVTKLQKDDDMNTKAASGISDPQNVSTIVKVLRSELKRQQNGRMKERAYRQNAKRVTQKLRAAAGGRLEATIASYKSKISKLQNRLKEQDSALSKCFSPGQKRMLLKSHKQTWWSEADISKAIVLRAKSTSSYNLVRDIWNIPLPGISTIQRWVSKVDLQPGIILPVMSLLKAQFSTVGDFYRQAVLSFDEMGLDGSISYDHKHDMIVGPHYNMLVSFVRGLHCSWKQPIQYGYDQKMTESLLFNTIKCAHDAGINVRATVCDLSPTNQGLKRELGISRAKSYFQNPVTSEKVWVFYDLPHLIKRLRDNTLDHVIHLGDGTDFSIKDFELLLRLDCNEIRVCHKVTPAHLTVKGVERMKVRPAMQLFSNSVSTFFKLYFPNNPRLQRLSQFINLVDRFVDLMNSRCTSDVNYTGSEEQLATLSAMECEIFNMRVGNSNHLLPFQHGFLVTINSIKGLYGDMSQSPLRVEYIMTNHVNQDIAENGFGLIRALGRYNSKPSALEAAHRLKLALLSWALKPSKGTNVTAAHGDLEPQYITSGLLKALMTGYEPDVCPIDNEIQEQLDAIVPDVNNEISQHNWKEYNDSLSFKSRIGSDAMEYMYGYILSKFKRTFPEMILDPDLENRTPTTFTQSLSNGYLSIPSYEWINTFKSFEMYFVEFHRRQEYNLFDLNRTKNVCTLTTEYLVSKFPEIDSKAIEFYVKVRTILRVKSINHELQHMRKWRSTKYIPKCRSEHSSDWKIMHELDLNPDQPQSNSVKIISSSNDREVPMDMDDQPFDEDGFFSSIIE